ncbi:MAG: glycosyltransferase family 2 protein [Desulfobacterales bacterium]|nr:glycosyltransferase family 2 protein [Desulfobacterales bacterium]
MTIPLFSIITPTYRRPLLLKRAISSVICQTFHNFELIVVDDAGGDQETEQIVHEFADNRIILLRHDQNKGAGASYNTGIKAAKGSFISILDDDDEYYPSFLEKTNDFFQSLSPDIGFIWTGIRRVIDTPQGELFWYERVWPSIIHPREKAYIEATTIGNGFGMTMRKNCINMIGLYNESFQVCEDTEYLFRLVKKVKFATIPEILVKIHRHDKHQLTNQTMDKLRLDLHQKILKENIDFIDSYPKLFYVHSQRIVKLCYSLKMKQRGRKMLLRMWRKLPSRVSIFMDLVFYEWIGEDMASYLNKTITKKLLSRVKNRIYRMKRSLEIKNFDTYRKKYDTFSFQVLVKKADKWLHQYPEQANFNLPPIIYWFDNFVSKPASVLEIGGWRGDLAMTLLPKYKFIDLWHNYDLITDKSTQKCSDVRYKQISLKDYIWNIPVAKIYNSLIATHMIEHIKWRELLLLINWIPEHITSVLFEAPLDKSNENIDWTGDRSTHILEKGWAEIIHEMAKNGFKQVYTNGNTIIFIRK